MNLQYKSAFKDIFFEKKQTVIPRANYLKLEQSYENDGKVVYAFFENADDQEFYRTAINYVFREYKLVGYHQEGKQNVIDGYKLVDWRKYKRSRVLFFVDKDYDGIVANDRILADNFFYTHWYSIENYLVTQEAFEIVLNSFFTHMKPFISQLLMAMFQEALQQFHVQIKALTRFILIFRRLKKELVLDNIVMTDFVQLQNMTVHYKKLVSNETYQTVTRSSSVSGFEKSLIRTATIKDILIAKCGADASLIDFEGILNSQKMIQNIIDPKIYVRGKYELWFFTELINTIEHAVDQIYHMHSFDEEIDPKPKRKIQVTTANAFHLLSSKLPFPAELDSFLQLNFSKIQ